MINDILNGLDSVSFLFIIVIIFLLIKNKKFEEKSFKPVFSYFTLGFVFLFLYFLINLLALAYVFLDNGFLLSGFYFLPDIYLDYVPLVGRLFNLLAGLSFLIGVLKVEK